jgi:hypothetical protein
MEIGKPIRTYTVEPLRDPVSQLKPAVARGDRLLERDVRGGAGRPRKTFGTKHSPLDTPCSEASVRLHQPTD